MIRNKVRNLKILVKRGYFDGKQKSNHYVEEELYSLGEESMLKGSIYVTSAIVGAASCDLEELGVQVLMGYEVAKSNYNNDGFTPFGQSIESLERIFGGTPYRIGEKVGQKVVSLRDRLKLN